MRKITSQKEEIYMTKVGCGLHLTYTHEDHHCEICEYGPNKETEYPCNVCFANNKCYWVPKL